MSTEIKNLKVIVTREKSILKYVKKMEKDGFELISVIEHEKKQLIPFNERRAMNIVTKRDDFLRWTEKELTFRKIENLNFDSVKQSKK